MWKGISILMTILSKGKGCGWCPFVPVFGVWRPVSVGCITPLQACTVVYCAVQRVMAWEGACKHSSNITAVSTSQCYHHHHQCDTPGHCQMSPVWVTSSHVSAVPVSVETSSDCILQSFHCQLLFKLWHCDIVTPGDGFIMTVGYSVRSPSP